MVKVAADHRHPLYFSVTVINTGKQFFFEGTDGGLDKSITRLRELQMTDIDFQPVNLYQLAGSGKTVKKRFQCRRQFFADYAADFLLQGKSISPGWQGKVKYLPEDDMVVPSRHR